MSKHRILVVEDDPTLRMLVQRQVKGVSKFETEAVASGEDAVARFCEDICMVFMDIGLPGIDGCQTAKLIREKEAKIGEKRIPIIALTGHADRNDCIDSGMTDVIIKPVLLADIQQILEKHLGSCED